MANAYERSAPERLEDRRKALEQKKALAERLLSRKTPPLPPPMEEAEPVIGSTLPADTKEDGTSAAPSSATSTSGPTKGQFGQARVAIYDRDATTVQLSPEPWLKALIELMLTVANSGGVHVCLAWPGRIDSLPFAHALATLERLATGDFAGLRTLLYPVKQTTFYQLNHYLLDRKRLVELCQQAYDVDTGMFRSSRACDGKAELLMALSTIQAHSSDVPYPTIAELVPSFTYDPESKTWGNYAGGFLKRSLTKLRRGHAAQLKASISTVLGQPASAPDAILGIAHGAKKEQWAGALSSAVLVRGGAPELLLLDATDDMQKTAFRTPQRIPDFLALALERLPGKPGAVVFTDDPATFFLLKKQLRDDLGSQLESHVFPAEVDVASLSCVPRPDSWVPVTRSLKHFQVEILDREASSVALRFLTAASELTLDSDAQRSCQQAAYYLLRLANLPGGYRDLGEWLEEENRPQSMATRLSWVPYEAGLRQAFERGAAGGEGERIRAALDKANVLLGHWAEHTPMALRLAREVEALAAKPRQQMVVVLPKAAYIAVAHRFLRRQLATKGITLAGLADRLWFRTHGELKDVLGERHDITKFIFVGLTDDTLRVLVADERLPAGSLVMLSYKQADTYQKSLLALKTIDVLKPYRGRISGLAEEIGRKLDQMPTPLDVDRLQLRAMTLSFESSEDVPDVGEATFWKLDLESLGRVFVAKRAFKYVPELDPPFESTGIDRLSKGDSIFVMTDELKDDVEATLRSSGFASFSRGMTFAKMLDLYHGEVRRLSEEQFPSPRARARQIQERMAEIDSETTNCSLQRIRYWLDLDGESDGGNRPPHAARDRKYFEAFARALGIAEPLLKDFWLYAINHTRTENRMAGRELADFYTNVLFHPESVQVYANIPADVIGRLQREAARCVFRVINIIKPSEASN